MTVININTKLHKQISEFIDQDDKIEYPSVKNFVDKAIIEKLNKDKKKK